MVTGFCVGLLADLAPPTAHAFGREAFVLCLVGFLAGRSSSAVRGSAFRPMMLIAFLGALSPLLYALLGLAVGEPGLPRSDLGSAAAASAIYAALLAPFIVPLTQACARRAEHRGPLPGQRVRTATTSIRTLGRREPTGASQGIK
jgi:rod shape-determining protein MreD